MYAKTDENLNDFDEVLNVIRTDGDRLYITRENRRLFTELETIKNIKEDFICLIISLQSIGNNNADIVARIKWFSDKSKKLVICDIPATYNYGVVQPVNQAVLETIARSLKNDSRIITLSSNKSKSGRNKLPIPENWDELYEQWEEKQISSKEFIERSGLKKATFYNVLTEYRRVQEENKSYIKTQKIS